MTKKRKWIVTGIVGTVVLAVLAVVLVSKFCAPLITEWQLRDQPVTEKIELYVYPHWGEEQVDSVLQLHITDKKLLSQVRRAIKVHDFKLAEYPGFYVFEPGMTMWDVVVMVAKQRQTPVRVTFHNVRTLDQFAERIARRLCFSGEDLSKLLQDEAVAASYGFTRESFPAMFLPDTYEFYWTVSPEDFLERMKREYDKYWTEERLQKAAAIGLTPAEVSTLAAIVEEETNKADELSLVAGLYINRLHRGILLQADPTLKFACGDFTLRRVLNKHKEIDSPYNTYKVKGLPPGPIRIPSKRGIDAVLNYTPHS